MAITLQRAREMFDLVNSNLCCPANPTAPCITFHFPDDGCWARAHEMCRLMIAAGEAPRKVWIRGYPLRARTLNKVSCEVVWSWHVAPTLEVATGGGNQTYVIDPALFNGPVLRQTWFDVQNNPAATLTPTGPEIFYDVTGELDPSYAETNRVLTRFRNELRLRSASADGPPPYTNCMVRGPGVQWFGSLAGNSSGRWFTWGWPARWHVIWTVMPLTPCPNGPQLTWSTAVERASAADCTYWITVRNLSADSLKFEGRFNVLSY